MQKKFLGAKEKFKIFFWLNLDQFRRFILVFPNYISLKVASKDR